MTSIRTTSLVQVILRSIMNLLCLVLLALTMYCHIKFDEAFKFTYAATLCPFIYNTVLIYAFWALFSGRINDPEAAVTGINFNRMVTADFFIVFFSAASAAYIAMMDLHAFKPGHKPSDDPYKADPWRLIAFGLQIVAGAVQLSAAVWTCAGCLKARKRYGQVQGHA